MNEQYLIKYKTFKYIQREEMKNINKFSYVTLVTDDKKKMFVKKKVLIERSDYFKQYFKMEGKMNTTEMTLKNVQHKELKSILNLIYHGKVVIQKKDIQSFSDLAFKLKIKGFKNGKAFKMELYRHERLNLISKYKLLAPIQIQFILKSALKRLIVFNSKQPNKDIIEYIINYLASKLFNYLFIKVIQKKLE